MLILLSVTFDSSFSQSRETLIFLEKTIKAIKEKHKKNKKMRVGI